MRFQVIAVCFSLVPVLGRPAIAQCIGDGNNDQRVAIEELITAVANALTECSGSTDREAQVIRNYADVLLLTYRDAEETAVQLQRAVEEFTANPSAVLLEAAKAAWLQARPAYLQSEAARFYDGPIDSAVTGPEGRLNSWPLDESYIDYVAGNANTGIINAVELFPSIDKSLLMQLNEQGGEDNIASGYHAIEFLLWGQDRNPDGNGSRPHTDYRTGASATAVNPERRARYLRAASELLVDDLHSVRVQWEPGASNYRAEFLALPSKVALGRILTGMGTLSGFELSNERMAVALQTQDQEDEHSCFSDNTHNDHRFDELGIQNIYLGRYGHHDGAGIDELVRAASPQLDQQIQAQIEATIAAIRTIPVPFDRAVLGADSTPGRRAIIAALQALRSQTALIEAAAAELDIDITTTK